MGECLTVIFTPLVRSVCSEHFVRLCNNLFKNMLKKPKWILNFLNLAKCITSCRVKLERELRNSEQLLSCIPFSWW